jgi:hypothetical protein
MRIRVLIAAVAIGLLAVPTGASAKARSGQVDSLAAQTCSQERQDIGRRAFAKKYGSRHSMQTCIRRNRTRVQNAVNTATADCQADLNSMGIAGFIDEYGDDASTALTDAMDECLADDVDSILNPDDEDDGGDDSGD